MRFWMRAGTLAKNLSMVPPTNVVEVDPSLGLIHTDDSGRRELLLAISKPDEEKKAVGKISIEKPVVEEKSVNLVARMKCGDWGMGYRVLADRSRIPLLFHRADGRLIRWDVENPADTAWVAFPDGAFSNLYFVEEILPKGTKVTIEV
jgi:hypothetical protein